MAPLAQYRVELETSGLRSEVLLNGVPVFRDTAGIPRIQQVAVNHWLLSGENVLQVRLGAAAPGDKQMFELEVDRVEPSASLGASDRVTAFRWWSGSALSATTIDLSWEGRFTVEEPIPRWAWLDAPAVLPSEADRGAILDLFEELHGGLASGDVERILWRLAVQQEETARAFGLPVEQAVERERTWLRAVVGGSALRLERFDRASLDLEPRLEGRLVFVADGEGRPPVRGWAGTSTLQLPAVVSRIAGEWTVVR